MVTSTVLDGEYFSQFVYYDPEAPTFLRRKAGCTQVKEGDCTGSMGGYWCVGINGGHYKTHRVIYALFNKDFDYKDKSLQIDHKDQDRGNALISNLRAVTKTINSRNARMTARNTSGITGVCIITDTKGYTHSTANWIGLDGKNKAKWFSQNKFGKEQSLILAKEHRDKMMQYLIDNNAGYTDLHGK